jgi:hypothetical protein
MVGNEHDRHSCDLADSTFEVLVAGGYDKTAVLLHTVYQAVVSIGALNY